MLYRDDRARQTEIQANMCSHRQTESETDKSAKDFLTPNSRRWSAKQREAC